MLFLILICLVSSNSIFAAKQVNATVGEFLNKQIEVINNATSELIVHDIINLREPPITLQCNKTNTDEIKIIRDSSGFIYMLSVDELLAIGIGKNKELQMHFVGTLLQIEEPVQDVKIESWKNSLVVVVRLSETLNIYITQNNFRGEPIEPIQKIAVNSPTDRFVLFGKDEEVYLVTYAIKNEADNELVFYKWKTSFFSKETSESLDLPNKSNLFIYNQGDKEPLILAIGFGNTTRVVILKLNFDTNRWTKLQSMHFKQDYIKHYVVENKLYLIGCSTEAFCAIYKWTGSQFRRHHKLSNQIFEKIKKVYFNHDIVVMENPQRKLSFFTFEDLVSMKAGLVQAIPTNVASYAIYKSPFDQKLSYAEFIFNKTTLAINFYEIVVDKVHERAKIGEVTLIDPIECVAKLKAILKGRMPKVQISQINSQKLQGQEKSIQLDKKKFFKARRVSLQDTTVSRVKMPYNIKVNANGLLKSSAELKAQVEATKISLLKSKMPKVEGRAEEDDAMENIVVQNLVYAGKEPVFDDLLLKSQPVFNFTDQMTLQSFTANKLVVIKDQINKIPLRELLNVTSVKQIKGTKVFKKLKVKDLTALQTLNNVPLNFLEPKDAEKTLELADGFEFQGDINVKHLVVKSLNGFNVSAVMENVFLAGSRNTIRGNLILQNSVNVDSLNAKSLMEVPVENLMTTSTNQTIAADVFITKFFVTKLTSDTINGEILRENVARVNDENVIEVPTQFMEIHILKNLNIKDEADDEERTQAGLTKTIETLKHHVIGTKTSDLSQIYNGQVLIQGSVTIKDLNFNSQKSRIFVGDLEVPQNISGNFWMKSLKQEIQVEKFTVMSQQMKAENVFVGLLNGQPTTDLLSLDAKTPQGPVSLRFEKAKVEGDVKGHKDNVPSLIFHLNRTAVPRNGLPTFIQSSIDFREKLVIRNLDTSFVNENPVNEFVHSNQQVVMFAAPKTVKDFHAKKLRVEEQLTVNNFNNLNLQKFTSDAVRIDLPIELEALKVQRFDAAALTTQFFEDHQFNEFISSLEKEFQLTSDGPTNVARNVRIFGNANFRSNIFLATINDNLQFNEFLNILVLKNELTTGIGGRKTFQQSVVVSDRLESKLVNEFPLDRLIYQSLSRGEKQTITGEFFVKTLKVKSMRAKMLNNITSNQFVDKTKLELPLIANFNVDELHVNNLHSNSATFDIAKMIELVQFPKRVYWNYVAVKGNSKIPLQKSSYLDRLWMSAVTKVGQPQIITGAVQVNSNKLYIKNLAKTDYVIVAQSNAINLQELFLDSLKSESSGKSQVIHGIKTFQSPIYVKILKIGSNAFYGSNKVNNVDVLHLNRTIFRNFDIVQTKKSFSQLHVEEILIAGKINEIPWNSMAFVTKNDLVLPQLTINELEVFDLETSSLNQFSLNFLLANRMRKNGAIGQHQQVDSFVSFSSLDLLNDAVLTSINGVSIDDAVFSSSDQLQDITGHKKVAGNIKLIGPSTITNINGADFNDFVKNSIWRGKNHVASEIELPAIELKQGLTAKNSINGYKINELLSLDAHTPKLVDLTRLMAKIKQQIKDLNNEKRVKSTRSKRLLYIDYDPEVQFEFEGIRERSAERSPCGDKIVEPSKHNAILVREKRDMEMTIELPSVSIVATPNFDCRNNNAGSHELNLTMIFKSGEETFETFKFTNVISDLKFLEPRKGIFLMILVMQNLETQTAEIVVEKLDQSVSKDWFEHQKMSGLNFITKSSLVETTQSKFLVISSFTDTTPAKSDYVMILEHDAKTDKFTETQKKIPGEKFDIILGVYVAPKSRTMKPRTFLLLTKERSKSLYIYRLKDGSKEFVFQRKIPFESEIIEVVVLYITGDAPYFIVSQQTGDFCLFEWRGIESWKVKQCGHFMNINQIKSYEYLKRQHLFLTSTLNSGTALSVYRQGELF